MWSRHDGAISTSDGRKFTVTIKEGYQIVADATDTLVEVANAASLPVINSVYSGSVQIRVTNRSFKQVSPILWSAEIVYSGEGGLTKSPLDEPPTISWGKTESDEAVDQDLNGQPIVNVNGEPLDGVTKKISDMVVTIKRNFQSINLPATYQYLHSVNSDTFLGFAPGLGRMTQFSAVEKIASEVGGYIEVSATIQFRYPYNTTAAKAWHARLRNEGFYVKRLQDNKVVRAVDPGNKQPVSKPVLLKADGTVELNPANAIWLEFPIYQPLAYNSLGLV